ncbi:tryptophan-rich sensory protein [Patescibacteria group bacterium]|nr:tryptophan-rich sensory protein [Patescibacteria group bacterium]
MRKGREIIGFAVCILIPLAAGAIGALFTTPAIPDWYAALAKPALTPPAWVFGPVWTLLYVLMGIAVFLVWRRGLGAPGAKGAVEIFFVQLVLNAAWSAVFFGSTSLTINGFNNIGIAFIEIIFLWLSIIWTIFRFSKVSPPAAWLLAPYILWVSFAAYLNLAIYLLNR